MPSSNELWQAAAALASPNAWRWHDATHRARGLAAHGTHRVRAGPRRSGAMGMGRTAAVLLSLVAVAGCEALVVAPFPEPLRAPKGDVTDEDAAPELAAEATPEFQVSRPPGVVVQEAVAEGIADRLGEGLTGDPIALSFHDIPLVAFINEIFGEQLGMSFAIEPGLQGKEDLVTLRLVEPVSPAQLFATARGVLRNYGVDIQQTDDGVLSFVSREDIASREIPLLVSGSTLPEVPASHRTIFQLVPVRIADAGAVNDWLRRTFDDEDLDTQVDSRRNALILMGRREMIERGLALLEVFDQPYLQSRHGAIFDPVFLPVGELASSLETVLAAEGYRISVGRAGGGSVLVPLESVNRLVVFGADEAALAHIEAWARTLDARQQETIEEATFTYQVRNTDAASVTETLNQVLALQTGATMRAADPLPLSDTLDGAAARPAASGRIVADPNRNLLLFHGSGREWAAILEVIRELDQPVPSVLIEVMVAEITLSDDEGSGFEFGVHGMLEEYGFRGGTIGGVGVGARGLSLRAFNALGETRALLNFFFEQSRVAIRSRPRLMVKSGESANIDVGNEIPVITAIADSGVQAGGSSNVLQQVSYRKTGIQLEITPIVQANGLVDLEISQQFSEARPSAATSISGNPTILNRQISTSLTLRDGGSVLMGGLISNNQNDGRNGVPLLGDVPYLGRLFTSQKLLTDRTELVVMVIPYVVADHAEGRTLTDAVRGALPLHRRYSAETAP